MLNNTHSKGPQTGMNLIAENYSKLKNRFGKCVVNLVSCSCNTGIIMRLFFSVETHKITSFHNSLFTVLEDILHRGL